MGFQEEALVQKICDLYEKISNLDSLKPSHDVNTLFTELVVSCIPPSPINVANLSNKHQEIRSNLIRLCGLAEGLLESHFSTILGSFETPLENLSIFPYFNNYLKLSLLEFNILNKQTKSPPKRVAFVGSGPLPLTSIVLASYHLIDTVFHNYDIDASANSMASRLVSSDSDLSKRMFFHTTNIMDVTNELKDYDVVFLAALVGLDKEEKVRVIDHLAKYMAPNAILMLRSAHGARAFLYPVVDPCDLRGFEVLSIFHPSDEVVNSVMIARKFPMPLIHSSSLDHHQGLGIGSLIPSSCKCCEIQALNSPFHQMNKIEDFTIDQEQIS